MSVELGIRSAREGSVSVRRSRSFSSRGGEWRRSGSDELIVRADGHERPLTGPEGEEWIQLRFPREVLEYFVFDAESTAVQSLSGQLGEQLPDVRDQVERALGVMPLRRMAKRLRKLARRWQGELDELGDQPTVSALDAEDSTIRSELSGLDAARRSLAGEREEAGRELEAVQEEAGRLRAHYRPEHLHSRHEALRDLARLQDRLAQQRAAVADTVRRHLPLLLLAPLIEELGVRERTDQARSPEWLTGARWTLERVARLIDDGRMSWVGAETADSPPHADRLASLLGLADLAGVPTVPELAGLAGKIREAARAAAPPASLDELAELLEAEQAAESALAELAGGADDGAQAIERLGDLDAHAARLNERVARSEQKSAELDRQASELRDRQEATKDQRAEAERADRRRDTLSAQQELARGLADAMSDVGDALRAGRIEEFERAASSILHRMTNKPEFYHCIRLDPKTLRYQLLDPRGGRCRPTDRLGNALCSPWPSSMVSSAPAASAGRSSSRPPSSPSIPSTCTRSSRSSSPGRTVRPSCC